MAPDGTVYLNTWSGVYYGNDKPHDGGFVVALKDTKATGTADSSVRFGQIFADGGHGGTGIALYKDWLYAETNDKIVRYDVKSGPPTSERPRLKQFSAACQSTVTTRCILSTSMRKVTCSSRWARQRMPAKSKTACRIREATIRASNSKHGPASGATTRIRPVRSSRRN